MSRSVGLARARQILERFTAVDGLYEFGTDRNVATSNQCYMAHMNLSFDRAIFDPTGWIPHEVGRISNHQTDLPRIAKDSKATAAIEARLAQIPTIHDLYNTDLSASPNNIVED